MDQQLEYRIAVLKREYETGQARLKELEQQEADLRETLLRISSAIKTLEGLLSSAGIDKENFPTVP